MITDKRWWERRSIMRDALLEQQVELSTLRRKQVEDELMLVKQENVLLKEELRKAKKKIKKAKKKSNK